MRFSLLDHLSYKIMLFIVLIVSSIGIVVGLIMNSINTRNYDFLVGNYYLQREVERYAVYVDQIFIKQQQNLEEVLLHFPRFSATGPSSSAVFQHLITKNRIYNYHFRWTKGQTSFFFDGTQWKKGAVQKTRALPATNLYRFTLTESGRDTRCWLEKELANGSWLGIGLDWEDLLRNFDSFTARGNILLGTASSSFILIADEEGHVLLDTGSRPAEQTLFDIYTIPDNSLEEFKPFRKIITTRADKQSRYLFLYPLDISRQFDRRLYVVLELDRKVILDIANTTSRILGGIGTLMVTLVIIGTSLVFVINLLRPLHQLKEAAARVSRQEYDIVVPVNRSDEFGEVSRTFVDMVDSIKHQKQTLEQEIGNRTREMKKAFNSLESKELEVRQEMLLAASIQKGLMSKREEWNEIQLVSFVRQVEDIGGDFVDNIALPERLLFYLSDVSGHGIPASLISILNKVIMLYSFQRNDNLLDIITEANLQLNSIISDEGISYKNYLTMFIAQITHDYQFQYLSAGHVPAVKYVACKRECIELRTTSSMLGVFDAHMISFKPRTEKMEPGDKLIIFSDGFVNAVNKDGNHFSLERVTCLIQQHGEKPAVELKEILIEDWNVFMEHSSVKDDVSLLVVERGMPSLKDPVE